MPQCNGIIKIDSYIDILNSHDYIELEHYSDEFQKHHSDDVFHQWSRQYEYPFTLQAIKDQTAVVKDACILDAGSGLTFFPFFLKSKYPGSVHCCDLNNLNNQYHEINSKLNEKVTFFNTDLRNLTKGSYDIIYCVSVLEHTDNYRQILQNFSQLLKDDGILILTFDISIDGSCDIPVSKARKLIHSIDEYFHSSSSSFDLENAVTTKYVNENKLGVMPWKYTFFDKLLGRENIPELTLYCGVYEKRVSENP